ncbi:MAG: PPC domain-containing protein [Sandaracinaceae bacterium]|nr:PPC domain-containing protein [Sandaracinaceae bacterium]
MRNLLLATLLLALGGCATDPSLIPTEDLPFTKVEPGKEDSSVEAIFLELAFDAELHTSSRYGASQQIEDQLLYTIGQLNGDNGVSRLDHLALEDVETVADGDGYKISYHASLVVAWGRRSQIPTEYTLRLPRDMTSAGTSRFVETYSHSCVDYGAHDVTAGSMWYYYRPSRSGCHLAEADVVSTVATVSTSDINTTGRFPEYDMVWADDALRVVAVFGKYEDGATSGDAGIDGYNRFLDAMQRELEDHGLVTTPAELPTNPGTSVPEVTFAATLADGRTIEVVAILVDNVRTAGREFDARYAELSSNADLIVYNGHAGLGANIRALASKGRWVQGQYAIVFMNGCDTYAYVDTALWDAHAAVNPDDETGTRYADIVMNAMPSYFSNMPAATMALVRGLMSYDDPMTYEQIFADISSTQVVLVSGEQDNTYTPGGGGDPTPVPTWGGITESGALGRGDEARFETPTLPAGRYVFSITGGGDADLYVRIGSAPDTAHYDCRPYRSDANETCEVELPGDAPVHLMVRGYTQSDFSLMGSSR